jgi:hypothetical protein
MPRIPSIRLLCLWVNFIVLTVGGDSTSTHKKLRQTQFHNQQITALHQPSTLDFSPQSTHPATAVSQPSQEDQINLPRNKSERRAPYQNDIPTSTLFNGRRKLSWWNSVWSTYTWHCFFKSFETVGITFLLRSRLCEMSSWTTWSALSWIFKHWY